MAINIDNINYLEYIGLDILDIFTTLKKIESDTHYDMWSLENSFYCNYTKDIKHLRTHTDSIFKLILKVFDNVIAINKIGFHTSLRVTNSFTQIYYFF